MSLLEVKNLSIGFNDIYQKPYNVVKNISFNLNRGEVLGIVGESGSGKSLTALSVLGLLPYPKAFHSKDSSIKFNGIELLNNPEIRKFRGKNFGFVFQEPMSSLNPLHTIGKQISETLRLHQNMTPRQSQKEVIRLLKLTGIKNAVQRYKAYPFELSGGQRQRIGIARALYSNAEILFFDEATSALDNETERAVMESIDSLINKKTLVIIAHRLSTIKNCEKVYRIEDGTIQEEESLEGKD